MHVSKIKRCLTIMKSSKHYSFQDLLYLNTFLTETVSFTFKWQMQIVSPVLRRKVEDLIRKSSLFKVNIIL